MASISKNDDGSFRILVTRADGRRPSIHLGKCTERFAKKFEYHLTRIEQATRRGTALESDTLKWIDDLTPDMRSKLVRTKIIPDKEMAFLDTFTQSYIDERTDLKSQTREHLVRVRNWLIECFGGQKALQTFTQADAKRFRRWLASEQEQGENTVRRNCGRAKQFFAHALESKKIDENPFKVLKDLTVRSNKQKRHFIDLATYEKLLAFCPDQQWRAILAMARIGGVRMPSEIAGMIWGDVLWEQHKIRIRSPKTEHHEGKAERFIPLWPELRRELEPMFEEPGKPAKLPTDKVFYLHQSARTNLRQNLERIIKKAGLIQWPKIFQNMRSSRATELAKQHPGFLVCEWLGHTEKIADEHYRTITDQDYLDAARIGSCTLAQNPAQFYLEQGGQSPIATNGLLRDSRELLGISSDDDQCTNIQATRHGFEP